MELRHTFITIKPFDYINGLSIYIFLMILGIILQNVDDENQFKIDNYKKEKNHRLSTILFFNIYINIKF